MSNKVIWASAGAGKTELLAKLALKASGRVLLLTYTNRGAEEIRARVNQKAGCIPGRINVETFFRFLLRDLIKPYQAAVFPPFLIKSVNFFDNRIRHLTKPADDDRRTDNWQAYYLDSGQNLYRDRVSCLAYRLNKVTRGRSLDRLEQLYDVILVDEVQDLAGWDLDCMELILDSGVDVVAVGDPRQFILETNRNRRRKSYRGFGMYAWAEELSGVGKLRVDRLYRSFRCRQEICDFADELFDEMPTVSKNCESTGHDGVFSVRAKDVPEYCNEFRPVVLRFDRSAGIPGGLDGDVFNIGQAKGATFSRVLIFPTKNVAQYIAGGCLSQLKQKTKARLYVGVTRARQSAALVLDEPTLYPRAQFWKSRC